MPDEIDDIELPERDEEIVDEDEKVYPVGQDEESSDTEAIAADEDEELPTFPEPKVIKKAVKVKIIKKAAPKKKVQKKATKKQAKKKVVKAIVKKVTKVVKKKKVKAVKKSKVSKSNKSTKGNKRGPKGPQWKTWKKIPYQENCTTGMIFLKAIEKHGITFKDLTKISKSTGSNPARNLKELRSGRCRGWTWEVHESKDRIRIINCTVDKHWKRK